MKLRLRSHDTKETLKAEVPNPCNLEHVKELISQQLLSSPFPSSIHLSLNRKHELTVSSSEDSIQSIGITSGDLIYFTTNPNGFSANPQILQSVAPPIPKSKQDEPINTRSNETLDLNAGKDETISFSNPNLEDAAESMEVNDDEKSTFEAGKSFSVPGFLRKVFTKELGDDGGLNHKLLAIAVHAVLLESGFVEFDPASNSLKNNNFDLHTNWYFSSFYYTLPDIISSNNLEASVMNFVKIKFQNLGKYCKIYGSLVNGTVTHSVLLNEDRLVPFMNVVRANCGQVVETLEENNTVSTILPETEVFEFWRKVKDTLALPLLIDLCEKAGLALPPCLIRLPTELKLKILESLSGVDIAKVSCVCSEFRYLASSDDLWKHKFIEQFGNGEGSERGRTFKERFAKLWESRKRRKIANGSSYNTMRIGGRSIAPFAPRYFPRIIGGDYDIGPNFGQFGQPGGGYLG